MTKVQQMRGGRSAETFALPDEIRVHFGGDCCILPVAGRPTEIPFRRNTMKNTALKVVLTAAFLIPVAFYAQPRPGNPTTATVVTKAEIDKIAATEQSQRVRDENAKVVDIGDSWSMELGIIHRASTRNPPPAPATPAGRGNAQTIPCAEQMAKPPADALPGAITH